MSRTIPMKRILAAMTWARCVVSAALDAPRVPAVRRATRRRVAVLLAVQGPQLVAELHVRGPDQRVLQALPFKVNDVGAAAFPVCVAWNPTVVELPGGIMPS